MKTSFMKKLILLTFCCSSLPLTAVFQNHSVQAATTHEKSYRQLKKINRTIDKKLYQDQFNQNVKDKLNWLDYVKSINYLKNDQLEIYVNDAFKKLKKDTRQEVINQAQLFAFTAASEYKSFSEKQYLDKLGALIFCYGDYLGRSEFMNNQDFIWNK